MKIDIFKLGNGNDKALFSASFRLGIATTPAIPAGVTVAIGFGTGKLTTFTRGNKLFELSNHLGNVLVTVTDKKLPVPNTANTEVANYLPDVATATDYYPFG